MFPLEKGQQKRVKEKSEPRTKRGMKHFETAVCSYPSRAQEGKERKFFHETTKQRTQLEVGENLHKR